MTQLVRALSRAGMAASLCGAVMVGGATPVHALEGSLGSLICSLEGDGETGEAGLGPTFTVVCSFRPENGGTVSQYVGTLSVQREVDLKRKLLIWIVRSEHDYVLAPGDLAQTYTAGGTVTRGTVAPLVPKNNEDSSLALYTIGDTTSRKGVKIDSREPKSDPVAALTLQLWITPA